ELRRKPAFACRIHHDERLALVLPQRKKLPVRFLYLKVIDRTHTYSLLYPDKLSITLACCRNTLLRPFRFAVYNALSHILYMASKGVWSPGTIVSTPILIV